jgi:hypothetical protein
MASWKKIIVSGSRAHLNDVTASFFKGDGSGLTNVGGTISNDLVVDNATIQFNSGTTYDGSSEKTLSIKDGGVDADALATGVAGTGIAGGGGTALSVDLNEVAAAVVNVANDSIAIIDADGSNATKKESIADLVSGIAGTGLDAASGQLSVDVSDFMSTGADNRVLTATGTDALQGEANLTFDGSVLLAGGASAVVSSSKIVSEGHISGSLISGSFYGDGSNITGVSATGLNIDAFGADGTSDTIASDDKFIFSDAGTEKRANISQLAAPLVGTGLEANSGTIRIAAAAAGTGLTGGAGSALDVDLSGESAVSIGAGTSTVTFGDNVRINGDLTIFGDTVQQNVANLLVEDKFILLNSGSASGDGGIIVQTNASYAGAALVFDDDINRWAVGAEDKLAQNATSVDSAAAGFQFIVSVSGSAKDPIDGSNPNDFGTAAANRIGMMHVNTATGDIFIYS